MRRSLSSARNRLVAGLVAALVVTAGLLAGPGAGPAVATTPGGTVSVLTYNVAGLPAWLSSGNPAVNTRPIGQRIGAYDVVHVQEDFNLSLIHI